MTKKIKESDLYEPVRQYFLQHGYNVHAEVNDCDVVAVKDDVLTIIELKLNLNITLLMQAADRQKLTSNVYVAIQRPRTSLRRRRWRNLIHLLRRLELGLILVSFEGRIPSVEVIHDPKPFDREKSFTYYKKQRKNLLSEVNERRSDMNIGGSHQVTTVTAYKEKSIQIAFYLDYLGPMSAQDLKKLQTGERTYGILYNNYYGWFKRIDRGVYGLTKLGRKEYKENEAIINLYKQSPLKSE